MGGRGRRPTPGAPFGRFDSGSGPEGREKRGGRESAPEKERALQTARVLGRGDSWWDQPLPHGPLLGGGLIRAWRATPGRPSARARSVTCLLSSGRVCYHHPFVIHRYRTPRSCGRAAEEVSVSYAFFSSDYLWAHTRRTASKGGELLDPVGWVEDSGG